MMKNQNEFFHSLKVKKLEKERKDGPYLSDWSGSRNSQSAIGKGMKLIGTIAFSIKKLSLKRTCNLCRAAAPEKGRTSTETQIF